MASPRSIDAGALPPDDEPPHPEALRPDVVGAGATSGGDDVGLPSPLRASSLRAALAAVGAGYAGTDPALRIAVCQLHAAAGDVAANVARVGAVLAALRATASRVDLAVFPEAFLQGYHIGPAGLRRLAVAVPAGADAAAADGAADADAPPPGHPLLAVAAHARRHACAVVLPFVEAAPAGAAPDPRNPDPALPALYNSVALFDADGRLAALYRKSHLWGAAYEQRIFTPGPGPSAPGRPPGAPPFPAARLRAFPHTPLGLLVCFDVEFPEPARLLALGGARVLVAVMASGEADGFTSAAFIRARAAENGVALAYCNLPASPVPELRGAGDRGLPCAPDVIAVAYSGGSAVVSPDGRPAVAARACPPPGAAGDVAFGDGGDQQASAAVEAALARVGALDAAADEHVLVADVDPGAPRYEAWRARNPYLAERRADLFGGL